MLGATSRKSPSEGHKLLPRHAHDLPVLRIVHFPSYYVESSYPTAITGVDGRFQTQMDREAVDIVDKWSQTVTGGPSLSG